MNHKMFVFSSIQEDTFAACDETHAVMIIVAGC